MFVKFRIFLIILTLHSRSLLAFTIILSDSGSRDNVNDLIREKVDTSLVVVYYESSLLQKCKLLGKVLSYKKINIWDYRDICSVRINELRKDVVMLKGNVLFVESLKFSCNSPSEGQAYLCSK